MALTIDLMLERAPGGYALERLLYLTTLLTGSANNSFFFFVSVPYLMNSNFQFSPDSLLRPTNNILVGYRLFQPGFKPSVRLVRASSFLFPDVIIHVSAILSSLLLCTGQYEVQGGRMLRGAVNAECPMVSVFPFSFFLIRG